jgi:hypothetical protein
VRRREIVGWTRVVESRVVEVEVGGGWMVAEAEGTAARWSVRADDEWGDDAEGEKEEEESARAAFAMHLPPVQPSASPSNSLPWSSSLLSSSSSLALHRDFFSLLLSVVSSGSPCSSLRTLRGRGSELFVETASAVDCLRGCMADISCFRFRDWSVRMLLETEAGVAAMEYEAVAEAEGRRRRKRRKRRRKRRRKGRRTKRRKWKVPGDRCLNLGGRDGDLRDVQTDVQLPHARVSSLLLVAR